MSGDEAGSPGWAKCAWCSAPVEADAERCPACGATLQAAEEPQLPGVTAVDSQAILWSVRSAERRRRSKLLTWLSGETEEPAAATAAPGALDPPPPEVRREMLRLEVAAELSELAAEAGALEADDLVEGRRRVEATDSSPSPPSGESDLS